MGGWMNEGMDGKQVEGGLRRCDVLRGGWFGSPVLAQVSFHYAFWALTARLGLTTGCRHTMAEAT